MLSVAGKKKLEKSNPLLKIISTPSQFSSKEMPGEVEVLKVCPTDDSSRVSARESFQTPSSNASAAGPSHWSQNHGVVFFWPHTTPLQAKESPLRTRQTGDLSLALPSSEARAVVGSQQEMVLLASQTML